MTGCRDLTEMDIAAMAELHERGFDKGWPEGDMRLHVRQDLVVGIGAPLTGFLILRSAGDQAELLTITVNESDRGQGLGRRLLRAGEAAVLRRGVEIIFLEVAEDNVPAAALYRACGYEAFGRRPGYYRREKGRVAALTFRKKLDGLGATG